MELSAYVKATRYSFLGRSLALRRVLIFHMVDIRHAVQPYDVLGMWVGRGKLSPLYGE